MTYMYIVYSQFFNPDYLLDHFVKMVRLLTKNLEIYILIECGQFVSLSIWIICSMTPTNMVDKSMGSIFL